MKAQILKIAGVKSEKEFYKKYPSEAAFMKVHGKAFKKAKIGAYIGGDTNPNPELISYSDAYDYADKQATGSTESERREADYKQQILDALKSKGGGAGGQSSGMDMGSIMGMIGGGGDEEGGSGAMMEMLGGMKHGGNVPKAYGGTNVNNWWSNLTTTSESTYPSNVSQTYGIGAQTMGKMQGPSNNLPGTQGSYGFGGTNYAGPASVQKAPPDTSNPNWMMKDTSGAPYASGNVTQSNDYKMGPVGEESTGGFGKGLEDATKAIPIVGGIVSGLNALEGEREAAARAKQMRMLTDLQLKASQTRPEQKERKYVRPEDVVNTGEAFFPIYGVGTNPLARNGVRLQGGGMIGGNPTEIQNTYGDGNSIYDDLGYVPLIDENQQKSFRRGGDVPKAQTGWDNYMNTMNGGGSGFSGAGAAGGTPWGAIGGTVSNIAQSFGPGGPSAGGNLGGNIGSAAGAAFGPIGMAAGQVVGTIAGKLLDPYPGAIQRDTDRTKRNTENIAMNQMAPAIQAGYASHMEDGGWVSNDWTPQVIARFGELDAQDYARFAHKDEFRAGGHLKSYTPPSDRAMETFAMGGELKTHWGGYAEPMSHNPYLPGSGETVMFRGKSHEEKSPNGETGIGITYGDNPVEVERGEPMVELEEGGVVDPETGEVKKSGVVFGNLQIPDQYLDLLGDPKAKGKKFKNYVADLSKTEAKQNKMIEKSTDELNALDVKSSFDRLTLAALEAKIKGGNMKLKEIADKKINAAGIQNAINETAEEHGLVADDLARGKVKQAKLGASISKAQDGKKLKFKSEKEALDAGYIKDSNGFYKIIPPEKLEPIETKVAEAQKDIPLQHADPSGVYGGASAKLAQMQQNNPWFNFTGFNPASKTDVKRFQKQFNERAKSIGSSASLKEDGLLGDQTASALIDEKRKVQPSIGRREEAEIEELPNTIPTPYKRSPWIDLGNQVLDFIRPTDQEPFDYGQTMGEMYALSSNQLEPVQAQLYHPELGIPYDISYQDVLNENQADFNALTKQVGYNPAAQSHLNANKYMANQRVLGDQFRANQAMKDKVYGENRNILNQAKLTNLGILDKQYERQSEAVSNTKATTQAALNSLADKMAKHKLENKTLGIYENLYKYRYDKSGRAINMNGIFQANIPTVGSTAGTQKQVPIYGPDGKTITGYQLQEMTPEEIALQESNNSGAIPSLATLPINVNIQTKNKKTSRNGSIVKAIKNL